MHFLDAIASLPTHTMLCLIMALAVACAFEFITGFHDTANAVTTVIYTRTLKATPAVLYSGLLNFIGVLCGGTAIAFGIVNQLPVDLLLEHSSNAALVMVLSLLLSGDYLRQKQSGNAQGGYHPPQPYSAPMKMTPCHIQPFRRYQMMGDRVRVRMGQRPLSVKNTKTDEDLMKETHHGNRQALI